MSKYIDAEKLIAEIERQEELSDHNFHSMVDEYDTVLDIIYSLQQEEAEVDLEKEIKNYLATKCAGDDEPSVSEIARHFYGLRNRALEEAARHVYESWMGGTMDDVRRDMVELGKVLNARKE